MIHAIILTFDEAQHILRCLESLKGVVAQVTVIDSGSTDDTVALARAHGADVVTNPWLNYATQFNFGIDHVMATGRDPTEWLMRIDADEVLIDGAGLAAHLAGRPGTVAGVALNRRIHFMGRRIRHGGLEPNWQLRLWRVGRGRCEARWMDEHIVVDGHVERSRFELADINLKPLTWWTQKHNGYASREAVDLLNLKHDLIPPDTHGRAGDSAAGQSGHGNQGTSPGAARKRAIKERIYSRLPRAARAFAYFLSRYILQLGVLDGRPGFYFHVLQGFWYRTLVDAKICEIEDYAAHHGTSMQDAVRACTGIDLPDRTVTEQSALPAAPANEVRRRA